MTDGSLRITPPAGRPPGTPPRIPYPRHSAYLAEALDSFRRQGAAGAPNIRTPAALGTNLLAQALTEYGARKQAGQAEASAQNAGPSTSSADQQPPAPAPAQVSTDLDPSMPTPPPGDRLQLLQSARAAIAGGQPMAAVVQQLIRAGVDPSGLWGSRT